MRNRVVPVIVEWDPADQAWTTYVPGLDIADWGETREDALEHARAAIELCLASAAELDLPIPRHEQAELVQLTVDVA